MVNDGLQLSVDEKAVLQKMKDLKEGKVDEKDSFDDLQKAIEKFKNKYANKVEKIATQLREQTPEMYVNSYFNLPSWIVDIQTITNFSAALQANMDVLSESELKNWTNKIKIPAFADYLVNLNKQQHVTAKPNEGAVIRQTPEVLTNETLMENILLRYRGKAVLIDFWATWCIPCKEGLRTMAPLKEALANEKVAFVCITHENSPNDIWRKMAATIRGEHYRLDNDQSRIIYEMFGVKTIPRYMLVNKSGIIVNRDLGHKSNIELKKLLLDLSNE